jgi:hypothetical protein
MWIEEKSKIDIQISFAKKPIFKNYSIRNTSSLWFSRGKPCSYLVRIAKKLTMVEKKFPLVSSRVVQK